MAVVARAMVAGDRVTDELAAGAGGNQLGGVGQISDDCDAGQRPSLTGAECASGGGGGGRPGSEGCGTEEGRHYR